MAEPENPPVIYLDPWCADCPRGYGRSALTPTHSGRCWWDAPGPKRGCESCDRPAVKYVLATDQSATG